MKKIISIFNTLFLVSEALNNCLQKNNQGQTEQKMKHLEFVQNIITRMNTNSFQIKHFVITIIAAILGVYVINPIPKIILISVPTTIIL